MVRQAHHERKANVLQLKSVRPELVEGWANFSSERERIRNFRERIDNFVLILNFITTVLFIHLGSLYVLSDSVVDLQCFLPHFQRL